MAKWITDYVKCNSMLVLVSMLVMLPNAGCTNDATLPQNPSSTADRTPTASLVSKQFDAPVTVTDRLGRVVEFDKPSQRIVSLSPETTELIFALKLGDCVVGVTEFCNYPEPATRLPRVGLGIAESISRESIVSLRPDLVVCRWDTHARLIPTLERLGIKVIALGPQSISELCQDAMTLGKIAGVSAEAVAFSESINGEIQRLRAQIPNQELPISPGNAESRPEAENAPAPRPTMDSSKKLRVYYELWNSPPITAGPKSFIGELLELAQLENIFDDVTLPSPQISFESVISRNPDIILFPSNESGVAVAEQVEAIVSRKGWENIPAVKKRAIYAIDGDRMSRCGPRIVEAFKELLQLIYPDVDFKLNTPDTPPGILESKQAGPQRNGPELTGPEKVQL